MTNNYNTEESDGGPSNAKLARLVGILIYTDSKCYKMVYLLYYQGKNTVHPIGKQWRYMYETKSFGIVAK